MVLSGKTAGSRYSRLSAEDRRAVMEILQDTLPDVAESFRAVNRADLRPDRRQ